MRIYVDRFHSEVQWRGVDTVRYLVYSIYYLPVSVLTITGQAAANQFCSARPARRRCCLRAQNFFGCEL